MWWHRKAWRVWVPLFVILLLLVCLAELGQDARWDVLKCNEIDICKTLYNFLNGDARENIDRGNMTNCQRNSGRVEVSWYSSGKLCKQASNVPASYQTFGLSPSTSRDFTLNASKDLSIVTLWPSLPDKLYSFFSLHALKLLALKIPKPTDHVAPTLNSPIASSSWASLAQLKNLPSVSTAASLRRVLVQDPEETIPQPSHSAPTPVEHSTSIYSPSPLSFPSISRLSPLTKHSLSNSLFLVQGSKLWKQYVWNPAQSSSMTRLLASIPAIDKSLGNLFIAKESLQFSAWSPTSNMKLRMLKSLHFKLSASSSISPSPAFTPGLPLVQHSPLSSRHRYQRHSHRRRRKPPSGVIYPPTRSPISAPLPLGPSSPPSHRGHHRVPRSVPAPAPTSQGPTPNPGTHQHPHPPRSRHAKSPRYPPSHSPRSRHAKSPRYPSSGPDLAPSRAPAPHLAKPPMTLPSPSAGQDCARLPCPAPLTETPLGSPCGCVLPIQVELELGVALYALFPLIAVLAEEIAEGTLLLQSEVRIMGANSNNQDQDKSIVDINLVPLGETFDNLTALLIFQKFWNHEVHVNETLFGNYTVIYVRYPGLPPSPPSNYGGTVGSPGLGGNEQPLGVNVKKKSDELGGGTIAVIALSSAIAVVVCLGSIWFILLKCSYPKKSALETEPAILSSLTKRSGGGSILSSDIASSTSLSFVSSMATYAGSAKTFTFAELERATNKFHPHNIVGEGGFGRVYRGVLDDGTKVAVKVLTRDDQQGGREFVAEVEMLSRLHHRNLVKLIGICTEEHSRCLVYELIPNGSVESHLHGTDKETAPLDWDARMKIALGAARGLAYLHEDSNPRVIHRDFKASNILLEEDFTPKVSDFGLAKAAPDESSEHISTRVMGTFGYVAPEYAMTGHLLVKSDVYSYGVVLLELLSGRKPVDMSQPPGQENLVTWARPLLTNKESLEMLVDPTLGNNFPFDNMARVAAIASMCVQPEVSYRPFMGEVVQALKLVYNDFDVSNGVGSANGSQEGESISHESAAKSGQPWESSGTPYAPDSTSFVSMDYDSGPVHERDVETQRPLSASALLSGSGRLIRQLSDSFRRHSTSGPLSTRSKPAWYRVIGVERGSISEHALAGHFGTGFDRDFYELWP